MNAVRRGRFPPHKYETLNYRSSVRQLGLELSSDNRVWDLQHIGRNSDLGRILETCVGPFCQTEPPVTPLFEPPKSDL